MGGGQLGVAYDARTPWSAVHTSKGHGTGLGPRLRLESKVHGVLSDGPRGVGGRFPGEVGPLGALLGGRRENI